MTNSAKLFTTILILGLICGLPVSGSMLMNGSFEEEGQDADKAAHWSRWGNWINRETDWSPIRDGVCLMGYHHWKIEEKGSSGIWQDLTGVEQGSKVTFALYANIDRAKAGQQDLDSVELRIEAEVYGQQTVVVSRKWPADAIAEGGDWSRLSVTTTAPAETLRILVVVTPGQGDDPRGGALKLDQAQLDVQPGSSGK